LEDEILVRIISVFERILYDNEKYWVDDFSFSPVSIISLNCFITIQKICVHENGNCEQEEE